MRWVRGPEGSPERGSRLAACLGAFLLSVPPAAAGSVDGAGNVLVVPLVFAGLERMSDVTVTNVGPEPITLQSTYVGAEGTPQAASRVGPVSCPDWRLDPEQSLSLRLDSWCPALATPDVENFGYLRIESLGDTRFSFVATTTVGTARGTSFAVAGQPVGAFDPGQVWERFTLRAIGLKGSVPASGQPASETLACYLATLDEPKTVVLSLRDAGGQTVASGLTVTLDAHRMQRLQLLHAFGLRRGFSADELRLQVASSDPALIVAGCGIESATTLTAGYQPAQTPDPLDQARLRIAHAQENLQVGPYQIGYPWGHPALGGPDRKVVLSTYLRPDDRVQCSLEPTSFYGGFDPRPWLELQVRDPLGVVVAGGNRALDTGVFWTGPRGRYPAWAGQRWHVDISFDEDTHATGAWPRGHPAGGWAVKCVSAAGMSALLGVDDPTAIDDF